MIIFREMSQLLSRLNADTTHYKKEKGFIYNKLAMHYFLDFKISKFLTGHFFPSNSVLWIMYTGSFMILNIMPTPWRKSTATLEALVMRDVIGIPPIWHQLLWFSCARKCKAPKGSFRWTTQSVHTLTVDPRYIACLNHYFWVSITWKHWSSFLLQFYCS